MDASTLEILEFCSKKIAICTTVPKDADNAARSILHSNIALSALRYTDSTTGCSTWMSNKLSEWGSEFAQSGVCCEDERK